MFFKVKTYDIKLKLFRIKMCQNVMVTSKFVQICVRMVTILVFHVKFYQNLCFQGQNFGFSVQNLPNFGFLTSKFVIISVYRSKFIQILVV